jgi:CRISPR-associated protein Cas2
VFVAIACDLISEKHRAEVYDLVKQYGFTEVLKDVFESVSIKETLLSRLKRDIDRRTDFYDKIKMYQYPIDGVLVVTMLADKKWRKTVMSMK